MAIRRQKQGSLFIEDHEWSEVSLGSTVPLFEVCIPGHSNEKGKRFSEWTVIVNWSQTKADKQSYVWNLLTRNTYYTNRFVRSQSQLMFLYAISWYIWNSKSGGFCWKYHLTNPQRWEPFSFLNKDQALEKGPPPLLHLSHYLYQATVTLSSRFLNCAHQCTLLFPYLTVLQFYQRSKRFSC